MIIGITRVRDESLIIADTLKHFFQYCEHIVLYDDISRDNTVEIAQQIGGDRITIIPGDRRHDDQQKENTRHRKIAFEAAVKMGAEWVLCFDADERLVLPAVMPSYLEMLLDGVTVGAPFPKADGYRFRLFDGYITKQFAHITYAGGELQYLPRMWGPEYRDILMLFRVDRACWDRTGLREPTFTGRIALVPVFVKHYGKCLSIEQWEETCQYYMTNFPKSFRDRWANRRGKAIHTRSDFDRELFTWDQLMKRDNAWEQI